MSEEIIMGIKLTILIVDDEAPARKKLRKFLSEERNITILEASDGQEAIEKIEQEKPDLVFLDIQMPKITGFEVIDAVGIDNMPALVFVTAYEQYAIDAFEVHALDYLLKPFDEQRFIKTYQRALDQIAAHHPQTAAVASVVTEIRKHEGNLQRILVKEASRYLFVKTADVMYFSSDEKYVELHTANKKKYLIRDTVVNLEQRLDTAKFVRIHRTTILNLDFLHEIQPYSHGDCIAVLNNGEQLTISRRYRDRLLK